MKRIFIPLAFAFMSFHSFAQVQRKATRTNETDSTTVKHGNNQGEFADKRDKLKLLKELNLTGEQKIKLKEMRQSNQSQKEEIMNNESLTEVQKQQKLKEIKRTSAAGLQGILTDEQKVKLKALRREKRSNMTGVNNPIN